MKYTSDLFYMLVCPTLFAPCCNVPTTEPCLIRSTSLPELIQVFTYSLYVIVIVFLIFSRGFFFVQCNKVFWTLVSIGWEIPTFICDMAEGTTYLTVVWQLCCRSMEPTTRLERVNVNWNHLQHHHVL